MSDRQAVGTGLFGGGRRRKGDSTYSQHGNVITVGEFLPPADFELTHIALPVGDLAFSTGITDGQRAAVDGLSRIEQMAEHMLVARGCDCHVGYRPHVGQVEGSVVSGAVFADETCSVDAEGHATAMERNVVDDMVVGALEKT